MYNLPINLQNMLNQIQIYCKFKINPRRNKYNNQDHNLPTWKETVLNKILTLVKEIKINSRCKAHK